MFSVQRMTEQLYRRPRPASSSLLEPPSILLSRCSSNSGGSTPQRRLLSCPSTSPVFHHLLHHLSSTFKSSELPVRKKSCTPSPPERRLSVPELRSDNVVVTKLDHNPPLYGSSSALILQRRRRRSDLDDTMSQQENGTADADAEASNTDTESELEDHKDDEEDVRETPYVANENEVFGNVSGVFFLLPI